LLSHASRSKSNPPVCLEAVPAVADNDKRQKERRAQEEGGISSIWLFENDEYADDQNYKTMASGGGGNLKIDISKELARIADMEIRYGCSKQEVERVIDRIQT
ncbi:hypothetical protein L195_g058859, partial [Trifolium pratense]